MNSVESTDPIDYAENICKKTNYRSDPVNSKWFLTKFFV